MSICIEKDLYVRIRQFLDAPHPLPLKSGFSNDVAYRALGMHSASETSEAYYILANDKDQTWFISNRHLGVVGIFPGRTELRFALHDHEASEALAKPTA